MRIPSCIAALAALVVTGSLLADDDRRQGEGKVAYEADLLRVGELNQPAGSAFTTNGTDPLDEGSVKVREEGRVEVSLRGAAASQAYSLLFCRFGFGPVGCLAVGAAGALATDAQGNGKADLDFPLPAGTPASSWAGTFLLTRVISSVATNEFVSGFRLRQDTTQNESEVTIDGPITALNAGPKTLRVGALLQDIFTDNATKYRGRAQQFSDLEMGQRVHINARTQPDGKLLALQIVLQGPPQGAPPRGRGKGLD